jgi:EAL domain-containing protein (putative c-di-GMP-specific phosphodiesterase class I)
MTSAPTLLACLQRLPVQGALKIDRSFVTRPREHRRRPRRAARTHPAASSGLGRAFGLQVVAEGVEDRVTLPPTGRAGRDLAQGYLLGGRGQQTH